MATSRAKVRLLLLRAIAAPLRFCVAAQPLPLPPRARVLLIRPDHIGDLLFLTPALRMLDAALPDARVTCMVGPWGREVLDRNPHIDDLLLCDYPGFSRRPKRSMYAPYRLLAQVASSLRAQRFDTAVILRFDHWWGALLAAMAGIPRRIGYRVPECEPFLTEALEYVSHRHEVQQNFALVARLATADAPDSWLSAGPLEFCVSADDEASIDRWLAANATSGSGGIIALHPGAGAPVKEWGVESFAALADALVQQLGVGIVLTGSPNEIELANAVAIRMQHTPIVAAGQTSLGELGALFRRCRLVVGADSGPLHLAVAVGTPTVHLYGPVDPVKFGPWGSPARHRVLTSGRACIPCNRLDYDAAVLPDHPCVREISVDAVLHAAAEVLSAD